MAQFELNWVGEYIPQNVGLNNFLNDKLTEDTYGLYYSVQFQGDAETYLLQAKKAPVEGQPEWGMIEMSKSGKSKRFKRVKREDAIGHSTSPGSAPGGSQSTEKAYLKDTSDLPRSFIVELLKYYDVQSLYNSPKYTEMINLAQSLNDDCLAMINANRGSIGESPHSSPSIKEPSAAPSLKDQWNKTTKTNAEEYGDEPYQD